MTSACFSRGHTGFSRNATLVATVNPPALAGGVFNEIADVDHANAPVEVDWLTMGKTHGETVTRP